MEPISTITSALAAGQHAVNLLRGVTATVKATGKAEALSDLLDAQMSMMELIQKHQEIVLENGGLKEKIRGLETEIKTSAQMVYRVSHYWHKDSAEGPFCAICYDKDHKIVRLHDGHSRNLRAKWICLVCHNNFND